MTDIVDKETRSKMMSNIKGKNTRQEVMVTNLLREAGLYFLTHIKDLPGKPDIVLPGYRFLFFINGCFWHGHKCSLFKMPSTNKEFWEKKITGTINRDRSAYALLLSSGWRIGIIWECFLRVKKSNTPESLRSLMIEWIKGSDNFYQTSI